MNNALHITVYLHPLLYSDSELFGGYDFTEDKLRADPNSISTFKGYVNAPLDCEGESFENPISEAWEHYIKELKWYIEQFKFRILSSERKDECEKSEYMISFGTDEADYIETIVCDLKMSDNPFEDDFPEIFKDKVLSYLTIDKILDGTARKAGIDFQVERTTVQFDSCYDALSGVIFKLVNLRDNWFNRKVTNAEDFFVDGRINEEAIRTIVGVSDDKLLKIAKDIMDKYDEAFKELAK